MELNANINCMWCVYSIHGKHLNRFCDDVDWSIGKTESNVMRRSTAFAMRLILGSSSVVVTDQSSLHEIILTIALHFHEFLELISNNGVVSKLKVSCNAFLKKKNKKESLLNLGLRCLPRALLHHNTEQC